MLEYLDFRQSSAMILHIDSICLHLCDCCLHDREKSRNDIIVCPVQLNISVVMRQINCLRQILYSTILMAL